MHRLAYDNDFKHELMFDGMKHPELTEKLRKRIAKIDKRDGRKKQLIDRITQKLLEELRLHGAYCKLGNKYHGKTGGNWFMNGVTEINGTDKRRLNQFGDYEDVSNMTVQDWEHRWELEQTLFHVPRVHPMIEKYLDLLTQGKPQQRIFLPLCGKSLDIKWLSDQGHEVVGNEAVDLGCRQFFEEHNIPYKTEPLQDADGVVYKATDGRSIELYRCDFFDMTRSMCGQFDAVWDRGGFVAIPVQDRARYATTICPLLKEDCRYLLDCFLVDNNIFGGPPFHCDEEDVNRNFSGLCSVKKIETKDVYGKWQESWGVKSFFEEIYMLEPK